MSEEKEICLKCTPNCSYFPDMSIKEGEWVWDKEIPYVKRRKEPKEFRCGYDNHLIDWHIECPKKLNNLHLENLKEEVENA